jgi:hypothetical protein
MSVLHDCPTLRELNLRGTGVADIHPLEEMPNLSNVDLPAGVDPSPLARCPALVSLCVDGRSVSIPELRMKYGQPGK